MVLFVCIHDGKTEFKKRVRKISNSALERIRIKHAFLSLFITTLLDFCVYGTGLLIMTLVL